MKTLFKKCQLKKADLLVRAALCLVSNLFIHLYPETRRSNKSDLFDFESSGTLQV